MTAHGPNPYGPTVRASDGLTATLTDGGGGLVTVVVQGLATMRATLLRVCELCDHDGLQVVTLSSPTLILGDLRGQRPRGGGNAGPIATPPERAMLTTVGRRDLLADDPAAA